MTTAELIARMEAMGWTMPPEITALAVSSVSPLTDQCERDLLAADFVRWLIPKTDNYSPPLLLAPDNDGWWSVQIDYHIVNKKDLLEAIVAAAEAAGVKQ